MSHLSRRTFATMLAAGTGSFGWSVFASDATPDAHDHHHDEHHVHEHDPSGSIYLMVGDTDTQSVSVYDAAEHTLFGTLDNLVINTHAGFLPLTDGSVLVVDDLGQRLLKIGVHDGQVEILGEASVPGHVAHIAVESEHAHYCAVGTSADDEFQLHLVDLETWEVSSLVLPEAAEVGLMLTHDHFFHRNNNLNQLEAYALEDLLRGDVDPLSTVPIGPGGHGEAVNEETGELLVATDDGIEVMYWDDDALSFGKTMSYPETAGAGRSFFGRLINNGRHFLTYTSDRSATETEWATWVNRCLIYDLSTGEATDVALPDGYTFRYALGAHYASFISLGADGDQTITIDVDADSDSFGTIIASVDIPAMSTAAKPGDAFYDVKAYRAQALTPEADQLFVSRGGDGVIDVIDPVHGELLESIQHTSALTGGGTLGVFGPGVPFADTIGR